MALDVGTWQAVVNKKSVKSTEFRALDTAVVQYLRTGKPPTSIAAIKTAWAGWERKLRLKGKTYKTSDRYTRGCALDDVALLALGVGGVLAGQLSRERQDEIIHQRDALSPHIRPGGTRFEKDGTGWKPKIFTQEQNFSCTCACATTFLNKLISEPVDEGAFKDKYRELTATAHDFGVSGTYWQPICRTLEAFGADVTFNATPDWASMASFLRKATSEIPVLLGVLWMTASGAPGGGHALMCIGTGAIPGWHGAEGAAGGFLIEDPWPDHTLPGLTNAGVYAVKSHADWSRGMANPAWGCVTGKKTASESRFAKPMSYTKGVKVM